MADDPQQTAKESKGFRNQLKKAFGLGSQKKEAAKLRAKYSRFRILVIGRANAGKTTLLKRVCNTTEDPCIYDKDENLLEPTSKRGVHDVHHAFAFESNPGFIFHDSPGFEAGGKTELDTVMDFIQQRSKSTQAEDQIHVIWFCFDPDVSRPQKM